MTREENHANMMFSTDIILIQVKVKLKGIIISPSVMSNQTVISYQLIFQLTVTSNNCTMTLLAP